MLGMQRRVSLKIFVCYDDSNDNYENCTVLLPLSQEKVTKALGNPRGKRNILDKDQNTQNVKKNAQKKKEKTTTAN